MYVWTGWVWVSIVNSINIKYTQGDDITKPVNRFDRVLSVANSLNVLIILTILSPETCYLLNVVLSLTSINCDQSSDH